MKKVILFASFIFSLAACSNPQAEAQEEKTRDSNIKVQKTKDELYVDSLERAELMKEAAAKAKADQVTH